MITKEQQTAIITRDHAGELPKCQELARKIEKLSNYPIRDAIREMCQEAPMSATLRHIKDREYLLAAWHLLDVIEMVETVKEKLT